jgi:N-acetyl sugar amidotransferase
MKYCTRCVYPSASAMPLAFDDHGVCSGCRVSDQRSTINWDERMTMFRRIVHEYGSDEDYDILIPVSGGKDSYFQVHLATKVLGLKPLLVTYHANNFMPEGEQNLQRMRDVFKCDHLILRPDRDMLVKMNRLGFRLQGDMNWHSHCGIFTVPIQIAVRYNIPLILWGEQGYMDLAGMYSYNDFIEFTAKFRLEHAMRGYDWHDFTDEGLERLGKPELKEGLTAKDLKWAQYPGDEDLDDVGVRGIYTSNFVRWDSNSHVKLVMNEYGWTPCKDPLERTYRRFSSLDDMHDIGIHDYLKFIKFGYGRGSDHSCHDIREGALTRDEGIEMVRKYDHVKPRKDLDRWLNYVGMDESEFDQTADTFRDPRVWAIEDGQWVKENIWGNRSAYGPVHLPESLHEKYKNPGRSTGCRNDLGNRCGSAERTLRIA